MTDYKKNVKALAKGTLFYAIGNLGTKIISFLIVPLYTYYITTAEMGEYDIIISTVALLTPLVTLRISDAAYRWMLHKIDSVENCISATYRIVILNTILSAVLILGVNCFIPIPYYTYFIGLLFFGRWLESLQNILRGLNKQGLYAASGIIYTSILVGLNLVKIVLLGQGIEAMFQSTIISQIITCILLFIAEPALRCGIRSTKENRKLTIQMLKYSAPLVPSALSWWVIGASDRYVIRFILGASATGIYAVASKFPTIISTLFIIFNNSWTDVAIGNLSEGKETVDYSTRLFRKLYELTFTFTLFMIPATKVITTVILASDYKAAASYIGFLYLGAVFQGFTAFISAGMLQKSNTGSIARSSTIGAIVNFSIDVALMKFIGVHAASLSTFAGFFIMWLCRMFDTKKISPVKVDKFNFSLYLFTSIIMACASIWTTSLIDIVLSFITGVFFIARYRVLIVKACRKFIRR